MTALHFFYCFFVGNGDYLLTLCCCLSGAAWRRFTIRKLYVMKTYNKALLPGTMLRGKKRDYRIDRVLGQGTFGITYLAYTKVTVDGDLGKLQPEIPVAVKEFFMGDINGREGSTVTTGGSGELFDKYRHKFARESANLANLNHANIVKVVETFEANGTSYYVMEYCGGGSLDARIAECGGLPQGEALRYFGQIASALSYMHSRRMLHLDLKPGNVMLRTGGEAVLIDFGLSKQFTDDGEPESSTTIGGGTPGYASLEQVNYNEDDSESKLPVTMDVYSLGATLYKMLTGKRPPVASDVLARFPEQPLRDHGVSDDVIAAIRHAMQPIPANRYQSVAAFAAALDCASEATEAVDREEEPEVVLVDNGRQPVAEPQPHTPAAEPARANQEQHEYPEPEPEPEQPRRKWLPWVVGVAVAAIAFVAVMLLQPKPQPAIEVPEDLITAVTQSDTVSADEQPVQQVAQQPQKPEPQRPVRQEAVEQPQPTRPESQQTQQQPQRPVQQEAVEQPQPTRPEPQRPVQQQPEPEPMPATVQQPQRPQSNLPDIAMVYVSGGTFTMGATSEQGSDAYSNEKPAHSVTLSGYYIGKYEVTQELWEAVMGSNPSYFKGDNLPVERVSWNDVQEFLRKLNAMTGKRYRLPTEAEWEFAARGGNSSRGYKYSGSNSLGSVAWYRDNSGSRTHAVGTKSPNELGIYDMSGNVWEWCQDWYSSSYYGSSPRTNPKGPNSGSYRVDRGGGWGGSARGCRVSNRDYGTPGNRDDYLGFRLAL